jgi:hypothetical protein
MRVIEERSRSVLRLTTGEVVAEEVGLYIRFRESIDVPDTGPLQVIAMNGNRWVEMAYEIRQLASYN